MVVLYQVTDTILARRKEKQNSQNCIGYNVSLKLRLVSFIVALSGLQWGNSSKLEIFSANIQTGGVHTCLQVSESIPVIYKMLVPVGLAQIYLNILCKLTWVNHFLPLISVVLLIFLGPTCWFWVYLCSWGHFVLLCWWQCFVIIAKIINNYWLSALTINYQCSKMVHIQTNTFVCR